MFIQKSADIKGIGVEVWVMKFSVGSAHKNASSIWIFQLILSYSLRPAVSGGTSGCLEANKQSANFLMNPKQQELANGFQ